MFKEEDEKRGEPTDIYVIRKMQAVLMKHCRDNTNLGQLLQEADTYLT